ncbi:MAG: HAD family phosphatase [Desulfobacterales bacterium]|nr:HAD family phosphatase [Desulfobacterales bacterium]
MITLANRINLADQIQAILWDMDGVLLDTLGLDLIVCNDLVQQYFGEKVVLSRKFIRSIFAYHPPEFWRLILAFVEKNYGITDALQYLDEIFPKYNEIRNNTVFKPNPGIIEILEDATAHAIKCAVVSNNPTEDVRQIVAQAGLIDYFDHIIGNDIKKLQKKPAPDTYLLASELLGVAPEKCVVVEDSLLGAEAGHASGCFTIGVCTGSADFSELETCPWTDCVYTAFEPNRIVLNFGQVTKKRVVTPNDFVSHMIEHIAWRLGCEIDLFWNSNDWKVLGYCLGKEISRFESVHAKGAALGMIDDGSAEVLIDLSASAGLQFEPVAKIDLGWFLSLRCEQLSSGTPLVEMLKGMSQGLDGVFTIRVCNLEDPHHTWEGIFRAVGIALNRIFPGNTNDHHLIPPTAPEENVTSGDISITRRSSELCKIERKTAESQVALLVDFSKKTPFKCRFNVSDTIRLEKFCELIRLFSEAAGCSIDVDFNATVLSSSHVAVEDTALVLGRALKEILVLRMQTYGVNAAGSSIETPEDFISQPIRVGVSVEGRKIWKMIPFDGNFTSLRKNFIIGQNVSGDLFSEDLDDFIDGLSGGLGCSIVIHFKEKPDPDIGWKMIFKHLGTAIKTAFEVNPYRKGVPPGVKATLA